MMWKWIPTKRKVYLPKNSQKHKIKNNKHGSWKHSKKRSRRRKILVHSWVEQELTNNIFCYNSKLAYYDWKIS